MKAKMEQNIFARTNKDTNAPEKRVAVTIRLVFRFNTSEGQWKRLKDNLLG